MKPLITNANRNKRWDKPSLTMNDMSLRREKHERNTNPQYSLQIQGKRMTNLRGEEQTECKGPIINIQEVVILAYVDLVSHIIKMHHYVLSYRMYCIFVCRFGLFEAIIQLKRKLWYLNIKFFCLGYYANVSKFIFLYFSSMLLLFIKEEVKKNRFIYIKEKYERMNVLTKENEGNYKNARLTILNVEIWHKICIEIKYLKNVIVKERHMRGKLRRERDL